MDLNVTTYGDFSDPRLKQAWADAVYLQPSPSIFSTYEWCASWFDAVGRKTKPMVLVANDGGRTVGLLPLCVGQSNGAQWAEFLGSDRVKGDHLDMLCDPNLRDDVADAFFSFLSQPNDDYDGLLLDGIACGSRTHVELKAWAHQSQFRTVDREIQTLPYIKLPNTFDEYLATLSPKRRSAVRRSHRKLAASGAEIRVSDGQSGLEATLEDFCRLHAKRWNTVGVKSNFADPQMRTFLSQFCQQAARHNWMRTYSLVVDERTEGVLLAFHFGAVASFYQIGRDPDSSVLNAGMVLMTTSIEQAIKESMKRFDFLRGDEPYKSRLAKSQSKQATVMIGFRRPATTMIAKEQMAQGMKRICQRLLGDQRWSQLKELTRQRIGSQSATGGGAA